MKSFRRQDGFSELELFQAAADHLASAKALFELHPRAYDSAGYLSHLGIELLMKALILNKCGKFPSEHSLAKLRTTFESHNRELVTFGEENETTIKLLEDFYQLRYPKTSAPIEIGSDDWDGIRRLIDFIIPLFPSSLQEEFWKLDYSQKGNRILMYREVTT